MKKALGEIKKHLLTAISYMLPLVVASGLLIAVGNLMGVEVVTDLRYGIITIIHWWIHFLFYR